MATRAHDGDVPRTYAALTLDALRKGYDGRTVVDGVPFSVEDGEFFAILDRTAPARPPQRSRSPVSACRTRAASVCRFSGGQQQRVSIAVALVGRPRAVVLDELTTTQREGVTHPLVAVPDRYVSAQTAAEVSRAVRTSPASSPESRHHRITAA